MTPRMAYDQARRESSMYRQGRGWIVSTYDPRVACYRLSGEMHYCAARCDLADWRRERAADLMAETERKPETCFACQGSGNGRDASVVWPQGRTCRVCNGTGRTQ